MPSPQPESKHWLFRTPGIAVVPDDLACRLFDGRGNDILGQRIFEVMSQEVIIQQAYSSVHIALEESEIAWDLIYLLKITRSNDNE
jgi:hypothetical protein